MAIGATLYKSIVVLIQVARMTKKKVIKLTSGLQGIPIIGDKSAKDQDPSTKDPSTKKSKKKKNKNASKKEDR